METDGTFDPDDPNRNSGAFVVAGLGASAGGVQALEAFFAGLPEIDGVAFVVVLHLAPDEESRLADVLQSGLPLPVTQVTERVTIAPGHVYIIPPGKNLRAADGELVLEPIEEARMRRRPIDHFFRTLGYAYGERAVGIVLSGTGANGTVGVRAVKEAGGMILAQDPDDAAFDEMPRSAIASGVVDVVGPAGALAAEVTAYAHRLREVQLPDAPEALPEDGAKALQGVLAQLRARTGHDFAHYKRSTVLRRLDRRLHVTGADSLADYLGVLRQNAGEAPALLDDLLISVTNFFRDADAFAVLAGAVPRLFQEKGPENEVRVWVPGCATGEEAYSIAMLLLEHADTLTEAPRVQVFASDLSERAIQTARAGSYPESIEADVSPERLRRFFAHENGRYRVAEPLREAVLFAPHSLLTDPPFSRLDLVSCRNLLIYLQRDLQQRVLALFHYALRPGGLLFLGTSEAVGGGPALFGVVDKRARLYRRLDVETPAPALPHVPRVLTGASPAAPTGEAPTSEAPPKRPPDSPPHEAERVHHVLREETAPPSVLVSESGDVAHVSDGAIPFLQLTGGAPTRQLARMLRPELRAVVQTALFQARREGHPVQAGPVTLDLGDEAQAVAVWARPAPGGGLVQVVFDALASAPEATIAVADADAILAETLRQTQEQLQVSVEEFETSREELRAQNEELQSINEELRSTAEELETSKEEAQSMAEELRTVNDELKGKVDETARAKGDLENLITSTEIATLFLDRELRIQRFTPHVRDLFHVLATDVGRPLADLAQKFGGARLVEDAEDVLARLETTEHEVEGDDGRWHLVRARPYRTAADRIGGVVVTFVDITRRKRDEQALQNSADRAAFRTTLTDALRPLSDPIEVQAQAARLLGEHLGVNRSFYVEFEDDGEHFVVHRDYTVGVASFAGRYVAESFGPSVIASLRAGESFVAPDVAEAPGWTADEKAAYAAAEVGAYVAVPLVKQGTLAAVLGIHQREPRAWTDPEVALIEEIAERTWAAVERARSQSALHAGEARLREIAETVPDVLFRTAADGTVDFVNHQFEVLTGRPAADVWGTPMWSGRVHPDDRERTEAAWDHARQRGERFEIRHRILTDDGPCWVITRARPVPNTAGAVEAWYGTLTDIDALTRAEDEVRQLNATLGERVAERTEQVRQLSARLTEAEEEERRRIALVLHDDLQQQLAGLAMLLSILWRSPATDEDREIQARATDILTEASALTRTLASEMSPPSLASPDFAETLRWLADRTHDGHGLDVTVEVDGTCEVPDDGVRALLYQALRELLFNVVKHAGTGQATLRAHRDGAAVVVEVEDDGDGFDPAEAEANGDGGLGLFSVRERVEMAGGQLALDSEPGQGTRVTLTLQADGEA